VSCRGRLWGLNSSSGTSPGSSRGLLTPCGFDGDISVPVAPNAAPTKVDGDGSVDLLGKGMTFSVPDSKELAKVDVNYSWRWDRGSCLLFAALFMLLPTYQIVLPVTFQVDSDATDSAFYIMCSE